MANDINDLGRGWRRTLQTAARHGDHRSQHVLALHRSASSSSIRPNGFILFRSSVVVFVFVADSYDVLYLCNHCLDNNKSTLVDSIFWVLLISSNNVNESNLPLARALPLCVPLSSLVPGTLKHHRNGTKSSTAFHMNLARYPRGRNTPASTRQYPRSKVPCSQSPLRYHPQARPHDHPLELPSS